MNTGTAIFLTVVLLVGAFIGLGYLINHSMDQEDKIQQLQEQLKQSQQELDTARQVNLGDEAKIQHLQDQVNKLTQILEQAQVSSPQMGQNFNTALPISDPMPSGQIFNMGVGKLVKIILMVVLVAAALYEAYVIWRIRTTTLVARRSSNDVAGAKRGLVENQRIVTVRMTRIQLSQYLKYQRMHQESK